MRDEESGIRLPVNGLVLGVIVVIFAAIMAFSGFYTVGQNERAVLTTWGQISEISGPGLHLKIPMMQGVSTYMVNQKTVSNYTPKPDERGLSTFTVDNQEVFVWLTVFYTVQASQLEDIYTTITKDQDELANRIWSTAVNAAKDVLGAVNTNEIASKRGEITAKIRDLVKTNVLNTLHVQIDDVQIPNIEYSQSYRKGVEDAAVAKVRIEQTTQERNQAMVDADRARVAALGTANAVREAAKGAADAQVTQATAQAAATRLNGEAQGAAILAQGQAQAQVIDLQAKALAQNPNLVQLHIADRWDGKVPVWNGTGPLPLLNLSPENTPKAQ